MKYKSDALVDSSRDGTADYDESCFSHACTKLKVFYRAPMTKFAANLVTTLPAIIMLNNLFQCIKKTALVHLFSIFEFQYKYCIVLSCYVL